MENSMRSSIWSSLKASKSKAKKARLLHSELDARLADVAASSHARQEQGFGGSSRNRGSLWTWAMLGLAHTPSVIALGCLDEGDERGEGQGLLLKSTWLRARYGYHDKVEGKEMKHGPQQLCRARPKHTR